MSNRAWGWLVVALATAGIAGISRGDGRVKEGRKVLVELYTSQACGACPAASDLLGKLESLGFGPDRVVPINFHVDEPKAAWSDPFADPAYARRLQAYHSGHKGDEHHPTPLIVVDGRELIHGSDRPRLIAGLSRALKVASEVGIDASLGAGEGRKTLTVRLDARSVDVAGRDLVVGVGLTEDPVTTEVKAGENAGRTIVEHEVARRFVPKSIKLAKSGVRTLTIPLEIPKLADATAFRVTIFVQDGVTGKVHQAESLPWLSADETTPDAARSRARRLALARRHEQKARAQRAANAFLAAQMGMNTNPGSDDGSATCPDCGSVFVPPNSVGRILRDPIYLKDGGQILLPPPPTVSC